MKKRFLFSLLAILALFLIIGMANSADLLPMKIGQKFIYIRTDSANPPNSWNNEMEVIKKENVCSDEYFKVKIWNYSIGETRYTHFRSTDNAVFECDADADMVCIVAACGPKGTILNCGDEVIEIMESKEISVPFGGPFTACVNRKHNEDEPDIPYWFQYLYIVPGVGMVKEVDWWNDTPPRNTELVEIQDPCIGDFDEDGDVDGIDLGIQVGEVTTVDLKYFADYFGANNCVPMIYN